MWRTNQFIPSISGNTPENLVSGYNNASVREKKSSLISKGASSFEGAVLDEKSCRDMSVPFVQSATRNQNMLSIWLNLSAHCVFFKNTSQPLLSADISDRLKEKLYINPMHFLKILATSRKLSLNIRSLQIHHKIR